MAGPRGWFLSYALAFGAAGLVLPGDAAMGQSGPGLASAFRSTGSGFTNTLSSPGGSGYSFPNGIWLAGDLNGDGRSDAVHAVQGTDYVHTWISNGNGTFSVGTFSPWPGYGIPNGLWFMADINGDRRADIIHVVANSNYVHTWMSNGNGTFNVGTFRAWNGYAMPNGEWHVGDWNGDGRADLIHLVNNSDYVHPWISNGNGTFTISTFRPWRGYGIPNGIWRVGDLNADGRSDLVHAVNNTDYVHTWMSNGNGTFAVGTFRPWKGYGIPNGEWLVGDIDGDRRADIVHAVANSNYVHTWRSQGNGAFTMGTFSPGPGYAIPNGQWMMGDIDADNRADLIHLVRNADYFHTWRSNGNGTFAVGTVRPFSGYPMGPLPTTDRRWLVLDFDGDRRADLLNLFPLTPVRNLGVARHDSAAITDAEADAALDSMTIIAFRNDNAGDRTCPVRYVRNGGVTVFNVGTGVINTQAQFNAVIAVPGEAKVVSAINWCGQVGANIIGCAPVPGGSFAVVRIGANQEGILWLHEHGHNRGNGHRNDTSAVMNPFIANTALGFDQTECNRMR